MRFTFNKHYYYGLNTKCGACSKLRRVAWVLQENEGSEFSMTHFVCDDCAKKLIKKIEKVIT
ncbi:MAG: hypothetical protein GOV00_00450 [Candidatus Altiarchaeota archaeon]|nr:hypothetical protein [Candidatus Altiarchaeota archaeon]